MGDSSVTYVTKEPFFCDAFEHIVRIEGGFVDNPLDPGGATKYGISLKFMKEYYHNEGLEREDVSRLTLSQAADVYFQGFWRPLGLSKTINGQASLFIFDQAVNRGIGSVMGQVNQLLSQKISPSFPDIFSILDFYQSQIQLNPRLQYSFLINFMILSQNSYLEIVKAHPERIVFLQGWMRRTQNLLALIAR